MIWAGLAVLALAWLWPLPQLGLPPFSTHMTMHMAVVAVAAPLLALGLSGTRLDLVTRRPGWMAAIPASFAELMIVWGGRRQLRARASVESAIFRFEGTQIPVTVSIGVAAWGPQVEDPQELVKEADERLYDAKRGGRNRVCG